MDGEEHGGCSHGGEDLKTRMRNMRYYWEALFSVEYFPYWEFTMLMMLCLQLSMLVRLNRLETMIREYFKD